MNVKYKVLATVSLQHDYYTDGRCPDFSIVPAPETEAVLKNLGAVYKMSGSKLLILVRADENGKAFIPVPGDKSFVFYMVSENPLFFNFTNIAQQPASHLRYYFTNRPNNQLTTGTLYLTSKVDLYNQNNKYLVGDLVSDGGNILEAIKGSSSTDKHNTSDPEYWALKDTGIPAYVNKNDLTEFAAPVYYYKLDTPAKSFTIKIYRYNALGAQVQVGSDIVQSYETNQSSIAIELDKIKLPAGYYNIVVNGQNRHVYLDANAVYRGVFGVIELCTLSDGSRLALLDATGVMKQPEYVVRFASRAVIWKYLTNENITGVAYGDYDFHYVLDARSGVKSYVSNIPIPLVQEIATADAPVKMKTGHTDETLAVPAADKLSYITQGGDTYFCIEKYLAY